MEQNITPEVVHKTPEPLGYYNDKRKQKKDFWIGFGGSIVGNVLLALLQTLIAPMRRRTPGSASPQTMGMFIVSTIISLLPWLINFAAIVVPIILGRKWIAFGILASYGAGLALAIIAGIIFTIVCFVSGSTL